MARKYQESLTVFQSANWWWWWPTRWQIWDF